MKLSPLVRIFVSLSFPLLLYPQTKLEEAKRLWKEGEYKKAGEILFEILKEKDQEISRQKKVIKFYREELKRLEGEKETLSRGMDIAVANIEATRLFREGWKWQHKGIFESSDPREKRKNLLKAIEIFRKIVVTYPYSEKADDAQYRIGRLYFRYLKEREKARVELEKLLQNYPQSEFVEQAKEMLEKLR